MTKSATDNPNKTPVNDPVSLNEVLLTDELDRRPSRQPDYEKENRALVFLAQALADSPRTVLQTLADTMLDILNAGSAGISLLTKEDSGKRFFWPAISGMWKEYIGGGTPREFGPCGDVLDRNTTLLFGKVEKRYTYFQPVTPSVQEALLVPFYVNGKAVGTIWAVAHDQNREFDKEDERLMKSLGRFASSAYQILESLDALAAQAAEAMKSERAAGLLTAIIDSSDDAIVSKNLDGTITSWNHAAERLFGYTSAEAVGQHVTLIIPAENRAEEAMILDRIKRGERIDHFETMRVTKDGTYLDISLTISPVKDANGTVIGASKIARNITERKQTEQSLKASEERLRILANDLENQVLVRTHQLEQRNKEILQQSEQLQELSGRLLQTQDDERRRIARDLHDSAGQIVTALSLNLANVSKRIEPKTKAGNAIRESQNLIHQLSTEIRTVSYLLHPPLLDENGLPGALQWFIQGLANRSGLKIVLNMSADFGRMPDDVEVTVFRIVQECLTNIHRHSRSKTATIRLSNDGNRVSLEIQDEGKGMPAEKLDAIRRRSSGVGITGMRERVRRLGGEMTIQSSTAGTQILITIPILAGSGLRTKPYLSNVG